MRTPKARSISDLVGPERPAWLLSVEESGLWLFAVACDLLSALLMLVVLAVAVGSELFERMDSSISWAVIRCSWARDATLKTASRRFGAELPQRKISSSRTLVEERMSRGRGTVPWCWDRGLLVSNGRLASFNCWSSVVICAAGEGKDADADADDDDGDVVVVGELDGCDIEVKGHAAGPALPVGNARKGSPRSTVAMPIAFPICEATWSISTDATGNADKHRYIRTEYVSSAYASSASSVGYGRLSRYCSRAVIMRFSQGYQVRVGSWVGE